LIGNRNRHIADRDVIFGSPVVIGSWFGSQAILARGWIVCTDNATPFGVGNGSSISLLHYFTTSLSHCT
jgi:hypothetical protein